MSVRVQAQQRQASRRAGGVFVCRRRRRLLRARCCSVSVRKTTSSRGSWVLGAEQRRLRRDGGRRVIMRAGMGMGQERKVAPSRFRQGLRGRHAALTHRPLLEDTLLRQPGQRPLTSCASAPCCDCIAAKPHACALQLLFITLHCVRFHPSLLRSSANPSPVSMHTRLAKPCAAR